jgi:predicted alpha/beta hydrolase
LYRHFAHFLAAFGPACPTFDYQGAGENRLRSRGVAPPLDLIGQNWKLHWGNCFFIVSFPKAELFGIAHSLGALI